jgi:hypothetical protein
MPWVGFEPTIPAFEPAKILHALDRAAIVIGKDFYRDSKLKSDIRPIGARGGVVGWGTICYNRKVCFALLCPKHVGPENGDSVYLRNIGNIAHIRMMYEPKNRINIYNLFIALKIIILINLKLLIDIYDHSAVFLKNELTYFIWVPLILKFVFQWH